jgi:hypothetical protein
MTKSLKRRHYAHMIGVDSGDLLVMGGHDTSIYAYSTAIYRLSSNVWNYVEAVISQQVIGSFSSHQRVALVETTDGYCT